MELDKPLNPDLVNTQPEPPAFKVFRAPNQQSSAPPPLPDEYFDPTTADIKAAQTTLATRTQALVNAPLQLRATREANEKSKRDRWPTVSTPARMKLQSDITPYKTTIRIRFTDRTQLEKVFPSTDKIRSVYAFVRGCLREDAKSIKFILYQSPPKRDLKVSDPNVRNLSLAELQLAPSSILLLRFEEESMNASNFSAPLSSEVLSQAIDLPVAVDHDVAPPPGATQQALGSTTPQSATKGGEKKIPKWLKLGLKK
ncbi:hypothetical protein BD779DRAFT_590317 [Infundibulicybe gibba]|nr:hypothetical protein BD779DRAFT_590317 [Infundibulicybe gibba]